MTCHAHKTLYQAAIDSPRIDGKRYRIRGITLIELMITVAVLAILATAATPVLSDMITRQQVRADIQALRFAITSARVNAISTRIPHTLCPLDATKHCRRNWNDELTLFSDRNRNRVLDSEDVVVRVYPAVDSNQVLRNYPRSAFSFSANGGAGGFNGSFSYCRQDVQQRLYGAALIISLQGRIRAGRDTDNSGLPETANGQDVPCPT